MPRDDRHDPGTGGGTRRYSGTFYLALREALIQLGWTQRGWRAHLLEVAGEDGREHVVGLDNIYRRARQSVPREQWPELIADFLRTIAAADHTDALPTDLASVTDRLLVRLSVAKRGPGGDNDVWEEPLPGTDLVHNLVIDYPDRMCYVPSKLVAESGRPGREWLERALQNLRARSAPDCLPVVDADTGIRLCSAGDSYDSSRALVLDAILPEQGHDGFFVAVPARDQLLVLEVNEQGLSGVAFLKGYSERQFASTPYPLSAEVYWIRDGQWHLFPIRIQGERVLVQPPEAFSEVLQRLLPTETTEGDVKEGE